MWSLQFSGGHESAWCGCCMLEASKSVPQEPVPAAKLPVTGCKMWLVRFRSERFEVSEACPSPMSCVDRTFGPVSHIAAFSKFVWFFPGSCQGCVRGESGSSCRTGSHQRSQLAQRLPRLRDWENCGYVLGSGFRLQVATRQLRVWMLRTEASKTVPQEPVPAARVSVTGCKVCDFVR